MVGSKVGSASELVGEIASLRGEIGRLKPVAVEGQEHPTRSVDELQAVLDDQMIRSERRKVEIEARRQAILALTQQLGMQESVNGQMAAEEAGLARQVGEKRRSVAEGGESAYQRQMGDLGAWYRDLVSLQSELTGCKAELVRPDYLLLSVSSPDGTCTVPVHVKVCPATGRLVQVQIGSTTSTPKRQWQGVIEMAIDSNSIAYLARQVRAALHH